jgi:hypothetical protein
MPSIYFEGFVQTGTAMVRVGNRIYGNTDKEITKKCAEWSRSCNVIEVTACALHNNYSDWLQVYGDPDGECAFADYKKERVK